MARIQKIIPNLWFKNEAEAAVSFYMSVFKDAKINRITRYGPEGYEIHGQEAGTVMTIDFQIEGQDFVALNGGPHFQFTEAISFIIHCKTQGEVDDYWTKLSAGGDPTAQQCGWLKDKFGVSWQIVPVALTEMLNDPDPKRSQQVMKALLPMKKLDIHTLQKAYYDENFAK